MQDLLAGMLKNRSYKHATAEVTVTAAMGGSGHASQENTLKLRTEGKKHIKLTRKRGYPPPTPFL